MAKKIGNVREQRLAKEQANELANELEVLHPERIITIGGQDVTVREYSFLDWVRMRPALTPVLDAVGAAIEASEVPSYNKVVDLISEHSETLLPVIAQAAGVGMDFLASLTAEEGEELLATWWGVNGRFFVRRALHRVMATRVERLGNATASATEASSPA